MCEELGTKPRTLSCSNTSSGIRLTYQNSTMKRSAPQRIADASPHSQHSHVHKVHGVPRSCHFCDLCHVPDTIPSLNTHFWTRSLLSHFSAYTVHGQLHTSLRSSGPNPIFISKSALLDRILQLADPHSASTQPWQRLNQPLHSSSTTTIPL